jgi:simple sugar transport system permease protein
MDFNTFVQILDGTVRTSTPLLLAALAGLYSERSGVFDIGLEGKMLGAAFASGAAASVLHSAWLGLGVGIVVAVTLALVHGFASITARGNQIVSGVAINFFAAGTTVLLGASWFAQGGRTPQLGDSERFTEIKLPFADMVREIPILGALYSDLISGHNIIVYLAFLMVPLTWFVLYRTRFGLRLRAVGENPAAVDTAGISVTLLRYEAVIICGMLCGLAGGYLAIAQSAGFVKGMTAGRGFIALAALIFAKWKPVPVLFACLLFGFLDAVAIRLQGVVLPIIGEIPVPLMQATPYVLTVILLAGFIGKAIPPRAGGVPYVKER